jgi:hypothetical protein
MSAERLLQLLRQRGHELGPLIVFHNAESLPKTEPDAITRALAAGRHVVNVTFVQAGQVGSSADPLSAARYELNK